MSPAIVAHTEAELPVRHGEVPDLISMKPPGPSVPNPPEIVAERERPTVPLPTMELPPLPALSQPSGLSAPGMGAVRALTRSLRGVLKGAIHPTGDFLYHRYWRVDVQGAQHLPVGGCVLVANHAGALPLDGPVLEKAIRTERPELKEARWLLEDAVLASPVLGRLMKRLGGVRADPTTALELLAEGRPVIVFPEGMQGLSKPISERYQLKRFGRGGYIKLALRAKVPIVPVAIVGAEEAMPLLARLPMHPFGVPYVPLTSLPLPARWHIQFGEPVSLAKAPKGAVDDAAYVEETNDQIRGGIEAMLAQMLEARASIFS
jgi:1-acyl-sn-glycerol-3-phosphate acyltransferase